MCLGILSTLVTLEPSTISHDGHRNVRLDSLGTSHLLHQLSLLVRRRFHISLDDPSGSNPFRESLDPLLSENEIQELTGGHFTLLKRLQENSHVTHFLLQRGRKAFVHINPKRFGLREKNPVETFSDGP